MNIYVWRGGQVLKNYTSGMVVVAAPSVGEAWTKLRAEDVAAWFKLTYGNSQGYMDSEDEVARTLADEDFEAEEGFPLQPEIFTIETLPALVRTGGE